MSSANIVDSRRDDNAGGLNRFSIVVDGADKVQELATQLARDGFQIVSGFRMNGYGEYESRVLDPEGNEVEIVTEVNDGR